jgi:DGQHR domain-containing protein
MAEFAVNAHVLNQNGMQLYLFAMNSTRLRAICYVTPRSEEDPEEVQRILDPKRARLIGEYLQQSTAILPNAIVVSLDDAVTIVETGNPATRTLMFPSDEGKIAYVLDGQHRLEGFKYSDGIEFDLPVIAVRNADDTMRGKIFADINSKQERVSDVHLLALYYQIKDLPVDDTAVMDVITKLVEDPDSPLRDRIQMMTTEKGRWIKNTALKKWLAPHLTTGGVLASKTVAEKAVIFKQYFAALSQLWPEAWGDIKGHSLCKPIGFEIMIGVFASAKHRCDLNAGRQYTQASFLSQLKPLASATIDLPGGGSIMLDWKAGSLGMMSNSTMRVAVARKLRDLLIAADEAA